MSTAKRPLLDRSPQWISSVQTPRSASFIPTSLLTTPSLVLPLILLCFACGEVEEISTKTAPDPEQYAVVIEPLLAELRCDDCHGQVLGGFRYTPAQTPAELNDNFLYVQRSITLSSPAESPLLARLTPPEPIHPVYFCPTDCRYQTILTWITNPSPPADYSALSCDPAPTEPPFAEACP
jgi:hypothetical protein